MTTNRPDENALLSMPPADLLEYRNATEQALREAKAELEHVDAAIAKRYATVIDHQYHVKGERVGTVRGDLGGGVSLVGEISKTVKWETDKLLDEANRLPSWERVRALFDVKLTVKESVFKAIKATDPDQAKRLEAARTVTYGQPKVRLEMKEAA